MSEPIDYSRYEGHTPDPWERYRDGDRIHVIRAGTLEFRNASGSHVSADWIAELDPDATGHTPGETDANSCLFEDAPKLLRRVRELEAEAVALRERVAKAEWERDFCRERWHTCLKFTLYVNTGDTPEVADSKAEALLTRQLKDAGLAGAGEEVQGG